MIQQHRPPGGEAHGVGAGENGAIESHASVRPRRQQESRQLAAAGGEHLDALGGARGVGDGEFAFAEIEAEGSQDPAGFVTDGHQRRDGRHRGVDARHGVAAPIEDEVPPVGGLLEGRRLAETPYEVGRQPDDRLQRLRLATGWRYGGLRAQAGRQKHARPRVVQRRPAD